MQPDVVEAFRGLRSHVVQQMAQRCARAPEPAEVDHTRGHPVGEPGLIQVPEDGAPAFGGSRDDAIGDLPVGDDAAEPGAIGGRQIVRPHLRREPVGHQTAGDLLRRHRHPLEKRADRQGPRVVEDPVQLPFVDPVHCRQVPGPSAAVQVL